MFPANITRAEALRRSEYIDVMSYDVHVDLTGRLPDGTPLENPDATFVTTTVVKFSVAEEFDTDINLIAEKVLYAELNGNQLLDEAFTGEHLEFFCYDGDHELKVVSVMNFSRTGEGLHRFVDPVDDRVYVYSQLEVADARRMYACFDQPDLKAPFHLTVDAPESWTVLSNSPTPTPTPLGDGFARWDFAATPRIATYITALVAGEFHTVYDTYQPKGFRRSAVTPEPRALSISVRQSLVEHLDADRIFTTTKRGFDVFEAMFQRPYPFDDYAQVFVPEFNFGAMENAGCVTFRDEYIFRSRVTAASYEARDNTILHEMAHMWFGDLVTMRWWDDLWLNESFAEWASHYVHDRIAQEDGTDITPWATFANARKTWAYRQDQLPSTHPIAADMVDLEAVELNFDGITYAKGASTLRQLVAFVGEEAFLRGVRAYFDEHEWGNTELADLLVELEKASGRDLSFFIEQWLQAAGVNTLSPELHLDGDTITGFAILQTADDRWPTLRRHRVAVGGYDLIDGRLTRVFRVELDIDGARTNVPDMVGRRRPDVILLNDDDLTYAKIRLDDQSLQTLVKHMAGLESPVARALCWGAAWDMCRDGEFATADYVDLVLRGAGSESDLTAVRATMAQARTAIDYYTPVAQRGRLASHFVGGVARLLTEAEPGSDHQLVFAQALSAAVNDETGAAVLKAWLAGREVPAGLVVDVDLRWRLFTDLARLGAVTMAELSAEQQRDGTATGAERAAGARAAMRDPEAKAAAWAQAMSDQTPNETHAQVCLHFVQMNQDELLRPYVDAYLAVVQAISEGRDGWDRRSTTIRQHVLSQLFPRSLADQAFLDRLDAWLAEHNLAAPVARLVLERRDDAARALRVQQAQVR